MKTARDHIARALAIKPDAHFGREAYQLRAMDWIIDPPAFGPGAASLPTLLDGKPYDPAEAIRGLAGLIVLGNAWESVDVFNALAHALDAHGDPATAYLARLRCIELIDAGRSSLLPDAPRGPDLLDSIIRGDHSRRPGVAVAASYRNSRAAAEDYRRRRDAFMLARLREGRHPDTDQFFWKGAGVAFAPGAIGEEQPLALNLQPSPAAIPRPRHWSGFTAAVAILAIPTCLILLVVGLVTVLRTMRDGVTRPAHKPVPVDPDWA